ncbi:hypothetical protein ScPMuIL_010060 [Solemya velum]
MARANLPDYNSLMRWTVHDVSNWLQTNKLAGFVMPFRNAGVDGLKLSKLTHTDLLNMKNCPLRNADVVIGLVSKINGRRSPARYRTEPERDTRTPPLPPGPGDATRDSQTGSGVFNSNKPAHHKRHHYRPPAPIPTGIANVSSAGPFAPVPTETVEVPNACVPTQKPTYAKPNKKNKTPVPKYLAPPPPAELENTTILETNNFSSIDPKSRKPLPVIPKHRQQYRQDEDDTASDDDTVPTPIVGRPHVPIPSSRHKKKPLPPSPAVKHSPKGNRPPQPPPRVDDLPAYSTLGSDSDEASRGDYLALCQDDPMVRPPVPGKTRARAGHSPVPDADDGLVDYLRLCEDDIKVQPPVPGKTGAKAGLNPIPGFDPQIENTYMDMDQTPMPVGDEKVHYNNRGWPSVPSPPDSLPSTDSESSGEDYLNCPNKRTNEIPQDDYDSADIFQVDYSDCIWYHGGKTRAEAESSLKQFQTDNMFLVRDSNKSVDQPHTLVVYKKNQVFNLPITKDDNYMYSATKGKSRFETLKELVEYYQKHSLTVGGHQSVRLLTPLPK